MCRWERPLLIIHLWDQLQLRDGFFCPCSFFLLEPRILLWFPRKASFVSSERSLNNVAQKALISMDVGWKLILHFLFHVSAQWNFEKVKFRPLSSSGIWESPPGRTVTGTELKKKTFWPFSGVMTSQCVKQEGCDWERRKKEEVKENEMRSRSSDLHPVTQLSDLKVAMVGGANELGRMGGVSSGWGWSSSGGWIVLFFFPSPFSVKFIPANSC